ncbi:MAG TPA: DnaJ domain-containing protein [Pyrinomonadaceae bacterium]|jgi:curved DNA-binding protein CbpA
MSAPSNLELKGNLQVHPFAELLVEIADARLDGSLRLTTDNQKIVVYFRVGEIVFAVSNSRSARLYEMLLRDDAIDKNLLSERSIFTDDFIFAKFLIEKKIFGKDEINRLFTRQIEEILRDAFQWTSGEWIFSPLIRIKEGIHFQIDSSKVLLEYARSLSNETVFHRFRSLQEVFLPKKELDYNVNLQSHEAFILSRFKDSQLSVEEVKKNSPLPADATMQTLYALWLGGFLIRRGWSPAFTEHRVAAISNARLALKKEAVKTPSPAGTPEIIAPPIERKIEEIKETVKPVEEKISLENYLERTEKARNHYESLAIETKAPLAEIKRSYFSLAKQFHPDHFHKETDIELHQRIQKAFATIAKAYETLRDAESRSAYDFKMRKELSQMTGGRNASAAEIDKNRQADFAAESFDEGFNLLMRNNYEEALPFLARAAHLAPNVARYRAYYGKVLSEDETQRYKAESELQTAVKLEPTNATFRIILAEFFIHYNLLKRAEGELTRFLTIDPANREARALLDSLPKK